ncbi:MAG: hypothetical protein C7B46_17085 [Sulfobacillus benefaciens]|uniref:Uncharacterized protein n=1 Tax=Sulfobacillus benefaciens TaxID=453960 RepID=A0A2T2X9P0_9FIRM|nr:MAG: hypothetical protein C7B46_17085 [Sulfobacillus benefaciens]
MRDGSGTPCGDNASLSRNTAHFLASAVCRAPYGVPTVSCRNRVVGLVLDAWGVAGLSPLRCRLSSLAGPVAGVGAPLDMVETVDVGAGSLYRYIAPPLVPGTMKDAEEPLAIPTTQCLSPMSHMRSGICTKN